jgi:hypothetical protein
MSENNKEIIKELISDLGKNTKTIGKADNKTINIIENELSLALPDSYKWFLIKYSLLLAPGILILGAGLNSMPICVTHTNNWRKRGLPIQFLVIEDEGDEMIVCLDTSRLINGECPVIYWDLESNSIYDYFPNFYQFLANRLQEAIDLAKENPNWFD